MTYPNDWRIDEAVLIAQAALQHARDGTDEARSKLVQARRDVDAAEKAERDARGALALAREQAQARWIEALPTVEVCVRKYGGRKTGRLELHAEPERDDGARRVWWLTPVGYRREDWKSGLAFATMPPRSDGNVPGGLGRMWLAGPDDVEPVPAPDPGPLFGGGR